MGQHFFKVIIAGGIAAYNVVRVFHKQGDRIVEVIVDYNPCRLGKLRTIEVIMMINDHFYFFLSKYKIPAAFSAMLSWLASFGAAPS